MNALRRLQLPLLLGLAAALSPGVASADKLRDVVDVAGARENQLLGYGIVTGLNGTGDDTSSPMAAQSVLSLLRRLGVQIDPKQLRMKNVAAVVVTASIGAFARSGTKLDVTVSSIGNAKSLSGGVLVQTLLKGADQKTYAVAQGSVLTGGFKAGGASGGSVQSGSTTAGRVPEGAIVEREIASPFINDGSLKLSLRRPSFSVAARIVELIDKQLGPATAHADDGGAVVVKVPAAFVKKPVELLAVLEDLDVVMVRKARVVVSERTQTIVAGGDVRLSPAVVIHGGLTIIVKEAPQVSQPTVANGGGSTAVTPRSTVDVHEGDRTVRFVPRAATLADVASALSALGLSPRELTSVLEALRTAGVLEAEVVVQ
jgi:flagellar P-ring protein precursor FlgI